VIYLEDIDHLYNVKLNLFTLN